ILAARRAAHRSRRHALRRVRARARARARLLARRRLGDRRHRDQPRARDRLSPQRAGAAASAASERVTAAFVIAFTTSCGGGVTRLAYARVVTARPGGTTCMTGWGAPPRR